MTNDSEESGDDDESGLQLDLPRKPYRRTKSGSGVAGKVISAVWLSASSLAGAAHHTWTSVVRYNRVDFAEVCCTADSQLSGEIITKGGAAGRYSHWNGFDLTTHKGATSLRARLEETQPRWVWFSPPSGPDSPMQNLNQKNEEQKARLETKRNRAHRIQRKIVELVRWLMDAP